METVEIKPSFKARWGLMLLFCLLFIALLLTRLPLQFLVLTTCLLCISISYLVLKTIGINKRQITLVFNKHEWFWYQQDNSKKLVDKVWLGIVSERLITARFRVSNQYHSLFILADAMSKKDHWILRRQLTRGIVPLPQSD